MIEWPARCSHCKEVIADWSATGFVDGGWIHKSCWAEMRLPAISDGGELSALRSPVERSRQLELPMLVFLLLFHFGLGAAIAGWLMLTQTYSDATAAIIVLLIGIVTPLVGVAGVAANIVSRRRIELIRQALDAGGGWKPGR